MTSENPSYATQLEFLCLLDLNEIKDLHEIEDLADRNCAGCHEPYNSKTWEFGRRSEYPVVRHCGHAMGLKCLLRMEELGHKECPNCLSPSWDDWHWCRNRDPPHQIIRKWREPCLYPSSDGLMQCMQKMKQDKPGNFNELARTDMAIQNAISTAELSRDLGQPVDWTKIFMQVYEAAFVSYKFEGFFWNVYAATFVWYGGDDFIPTDEDDGIPAVDTPDSVFYLPLLMLEAALRAKGFFKSNCDMPNVPQLQQDLDNLKKKLDSRPPLSKAQYIPEIEADLRRNTFITAVNELKAEKGEIGWTKHQQDSLQQETQWFFWQKVMILLLVFLAGLLVFLAATWGVLTEKE